MRTAPLNGEIFTSGVGNVEADLGRPENHENYEQYLAITDDTNNNSPEAGGSSARKDRL